MDKKLWETINSDLALTLEQLQGTMAKELERMGDIIYQYGSERFGVKEVKGGGKVPITTVSRRQQDIKRLILESKLTTINWGKNDFYLLIFYILICNSCFGV